MHHPFLQELIEKLSTGLGASVVFADQFGYAGYINFQNGRRVFFKGTSFDINLHGASKIAADKDYAAKLLKGLGYNVAEGVLIFSPEYRGSFRHRNEELYDMLPGLEAAVEFANSADFPLFIKPNEESEGLAVTRVYDMRQLVDEIQQLFLWTDRVLVQKPLIGNDFRVVVLDGEIISAYLRRPFQVRGDGKRTLHDLIDRKINMLRERGRGKKIDAADDRIRIEVARQDRRFDDIVGPGELVVLLPNANLSTGGEAEDFTSRVHPTFREYCRGIARDMGLALCGIDLITGDLSAPLQYAPILEINAAPGLNNFAASGDAGRQMVERLYERILLRLANGPPFSP